MIIPCIDLMGGKVVQLVRGREMALEGDSPERMLEQFAAFPVIQVIDLDQAMGRGSNLHIVRRIAGQARTWVGGGVRTVDRARELVDMGAERVIVGTAAFTKQRPATDFLEQLGTRVSTHRVTIALDSMEGRIVVKGWRESTSLAAEEIIGQFEPYCGSFLCTYVDSEGTMHGTDLAWYRRLRKATDHEVTAAGGIGTLDEVRQLLQINVHAALGMSIYTGRLQLSDLEALHRLGSGDSDS